MRDLAKRRSAGFAQPIAGVFGEWVDWGACFISLLMLLIVQWALSLNTSGVSTAALALFILPWIFVGATKFRLAFAGLRENWILLTITALALLSTAWSGYQSVTLKSSAEYVLTTMVAIIAASCIRPRTFFPVGGPPEATPLSISTRSGGRR